MKNDGKRVKICGLITALLISSMGGSDTPVASAAGTDVKLSKKSVALTIEKTDAGAEYGTAKIKVTKAKGVKIKKITCNEKKKGIVIVSTKGKNSPAITVKAKKKGNTKVTVSVHYQKSGKIRTKKLAFQVKVTVNEMEYENRVTPVPSATVVSTATPAPTGTASFDSGNSNLPGQTESPEKTPSPNLSGKNANDVAVLQKIIAEQIALGATISEELDSEQYGWDVEGRLTEINWGQPWIGDFDSEDYNKHNYGYLLTGNINFQGLTELEKLCIGGSDNHLTNIDVSENEKLTYLDCSWNKLISLDVSNNTSLQILKCRYNNDLSSLDVSGCTSLVKLDCCGNQIISLDLSKNIQLKMLWCGSNKLTNLDVSHNLDLEWLSSSRNPLSEIDLSNNLSLTCLMLVDIGLKTLDVSHNIKLEELDCGYNSLTELDVSKNTALKELYCRYNDLTILDVSKNTALTRLEYDSDVTVIGYDG